MIKKRNGIYFLIGIGIAEFLAKKVCEKKDNKIEKQKLTVDLLDRWMTLRDKGISVGRYLEETGAKKIGIYGLGLIGNHLYEELKRENFEIVGIDCADIYNNFQMTIYKPEDCYSDIDLIVVTPTGYEAICKVISNKYSGRIISFQNLLSKCEEYLWVV